LNSRRDEREKNRAYDHGSDVIITVDRQYGDIWLACYFMFATKAYSIYKLAKSDGEDTDFLSNSVDDN
jgi:hypothetical protein